MATLEPVLRGALAGHPVAKAFAAEILRVHTRYAVEVVDAFSLCPFMKEPETAFGHFCVMLDTTPDPKATLDAVLEAKSSVIHVIFPCIDVPPVPFERFAAGVRDSLGSWIPRPPVTATFHPGLSGDFSSSHRLVGVLRRAPDPFVQFVPEGLHEGGTVFIDMLDMRPKNPAEENFAKVQGVAQGRLVRAIEDIHTDRARSYAPYLEALLGGPR
jgi:hypothetical protein